MQIPERVSNGSTEQDDRTADVPSQAELYDALRKIGELEDKKQNIQDEIDGLTDRLKSAHAHLDKRTLLYKMLTAALPSRPAPKTAKTAKKATKKKAR